MGTSISALDVCTKRAKQKAQQGNALECLASLQNAITEFAVGFVSEGRICSVRARPRPRQIQLIQYIELAVVRCGTERRGAARRGAARLSETKAESWQTDDGRRLKYPIF